MLSGPSLDGASWHAWPPAAEEHASAKRVAGDDDDMALAKRPRSDDGAAVVAATVEQQQQALAAMRELLDEATPARSADGVLRVVAEAAGLSLDEVAASAGVNLEAATVADVRHLARRLGVALAERRLAAGSVT